MVSGHERNRPGLSCLALSLKPCLRLAGPQVEELVDGGWQEGLREAEPGEVDENRLVKSPLVS